MWDESKFLEDKLTHLSEEEAAYSLREAYKHVIGDVPSRETLACLLAQTALETWRWKSMHNGNWGNIKSKPTDGRYWTMFACGEILNGRQVFFKPPHDQCKFRAYLTPTAGAEDYIAFLTGKRYQQSLVHLKAGRVVEYTTALKTAGYFTANVHKYIKDMKSLFNEFMSKMSKLYYWKPVTPSVTPLPVAASVSPETSPPSSTVVMLPPPMTPPETPPETPPKAVETLPSVPQPAKKTVTKPVAIAGALAVAYAIVASLLQHC